MTLIREGLEALGLPGAGKEAELLLLYLKEIALWNPRYGLVNAEGDQLVIRHILDSLVSIPFIKSFSPETVADIGSGAGLPGIPLALFCPDVRFDLVERSGRRVGFLRNAVLTLGLKNVSVCEKALEELDSRYDLVTFRGFSPFSKTLTDSLKKVLSEGGSVLAYKGKREQIDEELRELGPSFYGKIEIIPVSVPFLQEERHLVTMSL